VSHLLINHAFTLLGSMAAIAFLSGHASYSNIDMTELKPATLQGEAMMSDNVRGRPVYHSGSRELWISGDKNIWRWNLESLSVTRYEMPVDVRSPFHLLGVTSHQVLGFDESAVWIFDHSARKWSTAASKFDSKCPANSFGAGGVSDGEAYFITSRCGIYVFFTKDQNPVLHRSKFKIDTTSAIIVRSEKPGRRDLIFPHKRELIKFTIAGSLTSYESVYSAKSAIRGVARDSDALFAWTNKAVIIFDSGLKRQQVVPVTGQRKIATFGAAKTFHVLTFDDGAVEFMDLKSKRKLYSRDRLKHAQNVDFIEDDRYMLVSSSLAGPRVFRVTIGG
jgi:hypothetical protein